MTKIKPVNQVVADVEAKNFHMRFVLKEATILTKLEVSLSAIALPKSQTSRVANRKEEADNLPI